MERAGRSAPGSLRATDAHAGAINTVNRVEPRPDRSAVEEAPTTPPTSRATTPDDTGGPAYLETKAGLFVAGIAIGTDDEWQNYARVSFYVPGSKA